jgi:hypothetical protein
MKSDNNVGKIERGYIFDVGQKIVIYQGLVYFPLFLLTLNRLKRGKVRTGKPVAIRHNYVSSRKKILEGGGTL